MCVCRVGGVSVELGVCWGGGSVELGIGCGGGVLGWGWGGGGGRRVHWILPCMKMSAQPIMSNANIR